MPPDLRPLAAELRRRFLERPFGAIYFWRFAVVRPHDQSYVLQDAVAEGDRLDLRFRDASGTGSAGVLSVWSPQGLTIDATGLRLQTAARLKLDDVEALSLGTDYHLHTPRGDGRFAGEGAPALSLDF